MTDVASLIWCPFPNEAEARGVATTLLEEGLIGCANIFPVMISLFIWEGKKGESAEVGVLLKTNSELKNRAVERLESLHSYDCPAIVAWDAPASAAVTTNWLGSIGKKRDG